MNLTDKLDELLKENNINKFELAQKSGIPYTTIDGLYKKGSENIKLTTLKKICAFFNCSLDFLAGDKESFEHLVTIQEKTGELIKQLRIKRELSQTELAIKVGYADKSAIAKIEAGKVDLPQSKLVAFANALDVTPCIFFGEDADNN